MKFLKGDILDAPHGIIGHQVNCQMVMGAGLAKQIRTKYPIVFQEYKEVMGKVHSKRRLGKCQMVQVNQNLYVANLFGQFHFAPRGQRHTDYVALGMALRALQRWRLRVRPELPIFLPQGLGCGLAGGEWNVVLGSIRDAIPDANIVRYVK